MNAAPTNTSPFMPTGIIALINTGNSELGIPEHLIPTEIGIDEGWQPACRLGPACRTLPAGPTGTGETLQGERLEWDGELATTVNCHSQSDMPWSQPTLDEGIVVGWGSDIQFSRGKTYVSPWVAILTVDGEGKSATVKAYWSAPFGRRYRLEPLKARRVQDRIKRILLGSGMSDDVAHRPAERIRDLIAEKPTASADEMVANLSRSGISGTLLSPIQAIIEEELSREDADMPALDVKTAIRANFSFMRRKFPWLSRMRLEDKKSGWKASPIHTRTAQAERNMLLQDVSA